ncbi:endonuclease/exonuclease/phosphatase family protein [Microlunatus antarcticus]|uniref:Endonuclease/exonuclease/phosphatase family metal-dependent hydrolase n=1 Tax=Microlunatus antarcticus TaxID=53388 RepID=A0A7W5P6T1_9ACTN|nr:endonuclease/exonuclease/phosphatase family protein [Microlunatus antarcticus]MBB3326196.1 endonuclease/exonuclease/phosphatase family metal-dependent hydrolase [Microlunatus antarcticus]
MTPTSRPERGLLARRPRPTCSSRVWLAGAAALAALVLPVSVPAGSVLSPAAQAAPVATVATPVSAPLRVASYNIRNANSYEGRKNEKRWEDRRGAVVDTILGQDLDVLAVQEATQGLLHDEESEPKKINQYDDLLARLGGTWAITNGTRYNCVKDTSPNRCTYADKGASEGQRILYDAARIEVVAQGSKLLPVPKGKGDNYMAWAELRQRSTGQRFLFSNLHTVGTDKDYKVKNKQAEVALAELRAHNPDGLPMIAVGDWNSTRFEKPSNGPYDVYVKAGFVDPLGGKYKTHKPKGATVEHKIRTYLNSSNGDWARKAPNHKSWGLGSYIDYILTTEMRVSEWETVARLDKKGKIVGTIPSDHQMIRATVWLPTR